MRFSDFRGFHKISNIDFHEKIFLDIEDDTMSLTTCFALCSSHKIAPFYSMVLGSRCICAEGKNILKHYNEVMAIPTLLQTLFPLHYPNSILQMELK